MDNIKFQRIMLEKIDLMNDKIDVLNKEVEENREFRDFAAKKFDVITGEIEGNREFQVSTSEKFEAMTGENQTFQQLVLKHFSILTSDLSDIKLRFNKLEIRMENEVVVKINALFDGQKRHEERFDSIDNKLDKVCEIVGIHDVEIKLLKQHL